jgi:hypothetical protein
MVLTATPAIALVLTPASDDLFFGAGEVVADDDADKDDDAFPKEASVVGMELGRARTRA